MGLFKYRSEVYRDLISIINNEIYVPSFKELNDPVDSLINLDDIEKHSETQTAIKSIHNLKEIAGIYSLSKTNTNELMWAYYANGHKGFCIEYDENIFNINFSPDGRPACRVVDYLNEPINFVKHFEKYIFTEINAPFDELVKCFTTKSANWKHENEKRIFIKKGTHKIPSDAIKAIYFGCLMKDEMKCLFIRSLIGRQLKFYEMRYKPNSFELEAHSLNKQLIDKIATNYK